MSDAVRARGMTVADVLWHDALHYADKPALRLDGREITYAALARAVEQRMREFAPHVAPGDRVALWFHNSFGWLAAFLALNALGAVSVPINTRLTAAAL